MAVSTKSRKAAKKSAPASTEPKPMSEARIQARKRNTESRSRAVTEQGIKPTVGQVEIYRLKNRSTGEVRVLIDARGDDAHLALPWLVTNGEQTVGFKTRKELGKNYSRADVFAAKVPTPKKARARRVAKKS